MEMNFDFDEQIEKLAKIPRPVRLGAVSALLVAVAAGYWFFSYQPKADEVTMLRANAQQLQRKLSNIRAVATNVSEFEQEVAELERELEKSQIVIGAQKKLAEILGVDLPKLSELGIEEE